MDEFDFMDFLDEDLVVAMGEEMRKCLFPQDNSSVPSSPPMINIESNNPISSHSSFYPSSVPNPMLLNFGNPNSPGHEEELPKRAKRRRPVRPAWHTYDHNFAERKRREHLSRHFVALSAILPGLKKMDKLSILGDAITHMKCLQERVKSLEEQARNKSTESVVLVNESQNSVDINCNKEKKLPQIEARVCNNQILIKIQCEYRKGLLADLIVQLDKLNLIILYTFATQFGLLTLEITFTVQMDDEFNLAVNEVVKSLYVVIKRDL